MSRRSCTPRSPLKTPILWTVRAGRCPKASLKSAAFLDGEGQILVWTHFLTHIPVIPVINNHSFTKVKTCVFLARVVQVPKAWLNRAPFLDKVYRKACLCRSSCRFASGVVFYFAWTDAYRAIVVWICICTRRCVDLFLCNRQELRLVHYCSTRTKLCFPPHTRIVFVVLL